MVVFNLHMHLVQHPVPDKRLTQPEAILPWPAPLPAGTHLPMQTFKFKFTKSMGWFHNANFNPVLFTQLLILAAAG